MPDTAPNNTIFCYPLIKSYTVPPELIAHAGSKCADKGYELGYMQATGHFPHYFAEVA